MLDGLTDVYWTGVVAGALGLAFACAFDWASLRGIRGLKQALAAMAVGLHGYALWAVVARGGVVAVPDPVQVAGMALLLPSLLLLVYSFLIEIPFAKTYAIAGSSQGLVTTGTYALVRHPGVLWYAAFLGCLFATTGSVTLLVAAPVWILLDIVYVYVQERFFFHLMFEGYGAYAAQTPMLVPTVQSVRRCLRTVRNHQQEST